MHRQIAGTEGCGAIWEVISPTNNVISSIFINLIKIQSLTISNIKSDDKNARKSSQINIVKFSNMVYNELK